MIGRRAFLAAAAATCLATPRIAAGQAGKNWRIGYLMEGPNFKLRTRHFRGLAVSGSNPITGYGILVVEDSDLAMFQTGNFRRNGIVLVTGRNVSSAFLDASNTEIRGALITNETNPLEAAGYNEFFAGTSGTMRIPASKENIDRALMALYNMRISAHLPVDTIGAGLEVSQLAYLGRRRATGYRDVCGSKSAGCSTRVPSPEHEQLSQGYQSSHAAPAAGIRT